jgi:hypothetical protein
MAVNNLCLCACHAHLAGQLPGAAHVSQTLCFQLPMHHFAHARGICRRWTRGHGATAATANLQACPAVSMFGGSQSRALHFELLKGKQDLASSRYGKRMRSPPSTNSAAPASVRHTRPRDVYRLLGALHRLSRFCHRVLVATCSLNWVMEDVCCIVPLSGRACIGEPVHMGATAQTYFAM